MSKRAFSPEGVREKAVDYHGGGRFAKVNPDVAEQGVKSLNVSLTFEEALKLSLALESCLQSINRYNRSTAKGRNMGVVLSVKLDNSTIAVIESPLKSKLAEG